MFWLDQSNSIIWGRGQREMGHHFSALYLPERWFMNTPCPPPSPSWPQEYAIQENQMFSAEPETLSCLSLNEVA